MPGVLANEVLPQVIAGAEHTSEGVHQPRLLDEILVLRCGLQLLGKLRETQ